MMQFGMDELKRRGYRGIHMLVNRHNVKAIRCYAVFGFNVVGECHMFDQDFLCYEKEL
jgi:ribosomal protein S18 acetylase RimI-like enzyme